MKNIFCFLFLLIGACATAQTPNWLRAKSAGGKVWEKAISIASDNAGYFSGFGGHRSTAKIQSAIWRTNTSERVFVDW